MTTVKQLCVWCEGAIEPGHPDTPAYLRQRALGIW